MKQCLTALLWAFLATSCFAQEFQISKGTDFTEIFNSTVQLPDQSYITGGLASGYGEGGLSMLATRTNSIGETMWTKVYSSGDNEDILSMDTAPDGSIYSCGYTYGASGNIKMVYSKINTDGSIAFAKQFGGPQGESGEALVATSDGGFAVVGYSNSYNETNDLDCLLSRFNSDGELLWATGFGSEFNDNPKSLSITEEGKFLVSASYTPVSEEGLKMSAYVLNENGSLVNTLHIGSGPENDITRGVFEFNNGYIVYGESYNTESGLTDVFLVHTDDEMNVVWQKLIGTDGFEHITSAIADKQGTFTICGNTTSAGAGGVDGYIAQFDENGDVVWTKTYGGESKDVFFELLPTDDDGYMITGYTRSFTSSFSNGWVIKTNERGDCACNQSDVTLLPVFDADLHIESFEGHSYSVDDTPSDFVLTETDADDIITDLICSFGIEDDGTDSTGEVTSISEQGLEAQLEAFPNPSEGMVYLTMPEMTEDQTLEVYTLSGALITRKHIPSAHEELYPLDLSDLGGGVYIIQMIWSGGVYSKRLSIR